MKRIRRKNGAIEMVEDDYVIQDGESLAVLATLIDGTEDIVALTRAAMAQDGTLDLTDEEVALHRPGFRLADSKLRDAADTARDEYLDSISNAWRGEPHTRKERRERQRDGQVPDPSDAKALRDAADEARRQYVERTCNAWRQASK